MQQKQRGMCGIPLIVWIVSAIILAVIFSSINKTGQSMVSIIVISCMTGALIGVVALFIYMAFVTGHNWKIGRQQAKSDRMNGITRYSSIMHIGGLRAPENLKCNAVLSPTELTIFCGGNEFSLSVDKIRNVDFQLEVDEVPYLKTSNVRGMMCAAKAGLVGAAIGSIPDVKVKREETYYALISYDAVNGQYKTIILKDAVPNIRMCSKLVDTLRPMINQRVNKVQL